MAIGESERDRPGRIRRVVYTGPDGTFAVVRVEMAGREGWTTAVGPLGGIAEGEEVQLSGTWETHPSFGEQLRVERAVPVVPKSDVGVERYLAGLPGIGPELAKRLVVAFGAKALDVLAEQPAEAAKVRGVGKRRAHGASEEARSRRADREVMVFLQGQGISPAYAARIRKRYGDQAIARVRENPYRLAREVQGIGFHVADRIARQMGIEVDSRLRVEAALYHALDTLADEGNVYAPKALLATRAAELVDVPPERLDEALASLVAQKAIVLEPAAGASVLGASAATSLASGEARLFLPHLWVAETALAKKLHALLDGARPLPVAVRAGRAAIELGRLSEKQQRAVALVGSAGVAVITGGPGTGKTTVMKATVALWEEARRRVVLGAPTGRAAKRLSEATGRPASTVHRLLEWSRGAAWGRDDKMPLDADLVVIDEASMLDVQLARALVAAVRPGATLLLVGDVDQLPSVGPGQVLADVINSGVVPVARLTEIFRQAEGSRIVETAHDVLGGIVPTAPERQDATTGKRADTDLYVISVPDGATARDRVVALVEKRIAAAFPQIAGPGDIQVLTPMHRGDAGTESLNRALQEALNPSGAALARKNRAPLRVGDKVLQSRNDYDRDVWNGDIGEVVAIGAGATGEDEAAATVLFDGRRVDYDRESVDQLELAYAVSIHKSQGSEYPAVVVVLLPEHFMLLKRNLLYTAITRGKKLVVIVAAPRALRRAVETADTETRYTRLRERLLEPGVPKP